MIPGKLVSMKGAKVGAKRKEGVQKGWNRAVRKQREEEERKEGDQKMLRNRKGREKEEKGKNRKIIEKRD